MYRSSWDSIAPQVWSVYCHHCHHRPQHLTWARCSYERECSNHDWSMDHHLPNCRCFNGGQSHLRYSARHWKVGVRSVSGSRSDASTGLNCQESCVARMTFSFLSLVSSASSSLVFFSHWFQASPWICLGWVLRKTCDLSSHWRARGTRCRLPRRNPRCRQPCRRKNRCVSRIRSRGCSGGIMLQNKPKDWLIWLSHSAIYR